MREYLLKICGKHADRYDHPPGSAEKLKTKISVIKEHCNAIWDYHRLV